MSHKRRSRGSAAALAGLCFLVACGFARGQEPVDVSAREEQAMKAAVARVAPSVVRIETIGGLEKQGKVLFGTGPTTGLIVSADGYVVSSAFNFAQKPTSILVGLADGTRTPAKLVATDHSRMLVLLKIETAETLPVPEACPEAEMHVGQWAIAVGRAFEGADANVSVGIVSALNRIFGKALQTDAKISPSNYGGPLVDIRGRVLGILAPFSPQGTGVVAGVEWYDSGIGFAVPLEHVFKVLPKLKEGKDLHPGVMGVSFKTGDQYADPAAVAAVRTNSPAYKAGVKAGDKIVEIDGRPIVRQIQVKENVSHRYAGDKVQIVLARGEERLPKDLELVDNLETYQYPFLGVLPMRTAGTDGATIRYVYPGSPAAKAGLKPGDRLRTLDGKAIANRQELADRIAVIEKDQKIALEAARGGEAIKVSLKPDKLPEAVPAELPPARDSPAGAQVENAAAGSAPLKIAEFENDCWTYVPESCTPATPHGVVLYFSPNGKIDEADLLVRWKPLCDRCDLILAAPQSLVPKEATVKQAWDPSKEIAFAGKVLERLEAIYAVDRARVVAWGYQGGAQMAYMLAFANREQIRGVVAVDAPLSGKPPDAEPVYRLAFFTSRAAKAGNVKFVDASIKKLRELAYPMTVVDVGDASRDLSEQELQEAARWIDTLDRI